MSPHRPGPPTQGQPSSRPARPGGPGPEEALARTIRVEGRRVLATLVRTFGDLELAQDAVQEAAVPALRAWPRDGTPDDPRAWLTVVARRKAYDVLRREAAHAADGVGR